MINIPTELLRTLVAVADLRSFTKAAQSLGVTQPAVSAQIKRLQLLLDCELFDKSAPGVSLTPSGGQILNQARRLLSINDQIVEISAPQSPAKSLRIGVTGDFSAPLLPPILAKFRTRHPDLRFVVQCRPLNEMLQLWSQGEIDLLVAVSDNAIPPDARHQWKEPMVWVRGREFDLDPDSTVPLVTFGESCAFHRAAVAALNSARRSFEVVFKGPSETTIIGGVRDGLGIGIVPRSRAAASGCVVCTEGMLPPMNDLFCGIYIADHDERLALEQLADALHAEFQSRLKPPLLKTVAL